jgi:hypothetical protein
MRLTVITVSTATIDSLGFFAAQLDPEAYSVGRKSLL